MTGAAGATRDRSAPEVLAWSRSLVDPALREAVATLPGSLRRIAGYHLGWWDADGQQSGTGSGGKAIRPALTLLAAEALGGEAAHALPAAVAVELVHNFSLIQDDVIDGDLTRRHRPTTWSVFGPGAAIVAGDALLTLAFDTLTGSAGPDPPEQPGAGARWPSRVLHSAVLSLLEGQATDLAFEKRTDVSLAECVSMAQAKTGALLGCAGALGAWCAEGTPAQVAYLRGFGEQLGLAFQLADDLLGIWGDPAATGKPVFSDLQRGKKSVPLVAALASGTRAGDELAALAHRSRPLSDTELARAAGMVEEAGGRSWARARAEDLLAGSLRQLRSALAAGDPTGATGDPARAARELAALARLVVHRDH